MATDITFFLVIFIFFQIYNETRRAQRILTTRLQQSNYSNLSEMYFQTHR